jgi:hypothetical protein
MLQMFFDNLFSSGCVYKTFCFALPVKCDSRLNINWKTNDKENATCILGYLAVSNCRIVGANEQNNR